MIKTIYKCDCCLKEWDADSRDDQICSVSIDVSFGQIAKQNTFYSKDKHQQWCRSCVMKTGIIQPITDDDKKLAPETPLSFQEKFTLLVEELGFLRE